MATTTELVKDYQVELAGSIQFPIPNEIFDDLGFAPCPMLRARRVQSASLQPDGKPPILLYSDHPAAGAPERHVGTGRRDGHGRSGRLGLRANPARAIGRFDVRRPPQIDWTRCGPAPPTKPGARPNPYRHVRQRDGCHQSLSAPDPVLHAPVRSMLSFLAVNSTCRGPSPRQRPGLAFALASPGEATMSKVKGGIGAMSDFHLRSALRAARRRTTAPHQGDGYSHQRRAVEGDAWAKSGEVVTAPVVVSNLDPTATFTQLLDRDELPAEFARRIDTIDHRAAYFQIHFALNGLPEFVGPNEVLNQGGLRRNVTMFGTAEQMQRDYEDCVRGLVPAAPSFNLQIPTLTEPGMAPAGVTHAASGFRLYFPYRRQPRRSRPLARRDGGPAGRQADQRGPELSRSH